MKKTEFLAQLRSRLGQLPPRDVDATLEYYSEMIDDYIEVVTVPMRRLPKWVALIALPHKFSREQELPFMLPT